MSNNHSPTPEELNDPRLGLPQPLTVPKKPPLGRRKGLTNYGKRKDKADADARELNEKLARQLSEVNQKLDEEQKFRREIEAQKNSGFPKFTLPHFVSRFSPDDPREANEIILGLLKHYMESDQRIENMVVRFERFEYGPKYDLKSWERLCKAERLSQADFIGKVTSAAFQMGKNYAQQSIAMVIDDVVMARAEFAKRELDAGGDAERLMKAAGLISDKSSSVVVQTGAQFNGPTQVNQGMQLPRLSETTGGIHSQVMEERRRMLQPVDMSGVIEVEKKEGEEVYETRTQT